MIRYGDMMVVDGVPGVLKGVREVLRQSATQIKIAVGGGTQVCVHFYNVDGIRRAFDNGPKSIEHARLLRASQSLSRQARRDRRGSPRANSPHQQRPVEGHLDPHHPEENVASIM